MPDDLILPLLRYLSILPHCNALQDSIISVWSIGHESDKKYTMCFFYYSRIIHYSPEFWQVVNMEYLHNNDSMQVSCPSLYRVSCPHYALEMALYHMFCSVIYVAMIISSELTLVLVLPEALHTDIRIIIHKRSSLEQWMFFSSFILSISKHSFLNVFTRSFGVLRAPTFSLQPFGPP